MEVEREREREIPSLDEVDERGNLSGCQDSLPVDIVDVDQVVYLVQVEKGKEKGRETGKGKGKGKARKRNKNVDTATSHPRSRVAVPSLLVLVGSFLFHLFFKSKK